MSPLEHRPRKKSATHKGKRPAQNLAKSSRRTRSKAAHLKSKQSAKATARSSHQGPATITRPKIAANKGLTDEFGRDFENPT